MDSRRPEEVLGILIRHLVPLRQGSSLWFPGSFPVLTQEEAHFCLPALETLNPILYSLLCIDLSLLSECRDFFSFLFKSPTSISGLYYRGYPNE